MLDDSNKITTANDKHLKPRRADDMVSHALRRFFFAPAVRYTLPFANTV
ncbi:MAG: hypothetical protein ACN6N0_07970 [Microvirgula sp.]